MSKRKSAEQSILSILKKFDIAIKHNESCLQEANACLQSPGLDDPALSDWTDMAFVTIDNPDSRDLDQALLIESEPGTGYRVRYALADAAYYVPPGSELFAEALRRGVTYYTPVLAAPMLPSILSEGLVSLNANVDRRALVFDIQLSEDAEVFKTSITRARIRSQAKLSYAGVQAFLDGDNSLAEEEFADSLKLLKELGEKLIQRALDRDVIPFNRNEAEIQLTEKGIQLSERERVRTEKYNEQISLLCNMQGARLLEGFGKHNLQLQAIYRAHDAPLTGKLKQLRQLIDALAEKADLDANWRWHKDQSLADFVEGLPDAEATLPRKLAIERQILVSNQASEYRSKPGRHHALAATSYARFSSPMREIVGIFTHKELIEALGLEASAFTQPEQRSFNDEQLREQIIEVANLSRQTQKQINKAVEFLAIQQVLDRDLKQQPAPMHEAIIMGFRRDRVYIACEDLAIDLKISMSDLEAQYNTSYEIDAISATASTADAPAWQLGDRVRIRVSGFNEMSKRYQLALFSHQ